MLILPAIDIYDGKCVRLEQGRFAARSLYSDSPVEVARSFLENGLPNVHVIDLEGAQAGQIKNWKVILSILALNGAQAQVGGGIRTVGDARNLIAAGAARIIVGSLALQVPTILAGWLQEFGVDRVAVAIDTRDGTVAYKGWMEQIELSPAAVVSKMQSVGVKVFLCTDIARDGMLQGPNVELYRHLHAEFPTIYLIASGGVTSIADLHQLQQAGCSAAIVGKALYEDRIKLSDLRQFMEQ